MGNAKKYMKNTRTLYRSIKQEDQKKIRHWSSLGPGLGLVYQIKRFCEVSEPVGGRSNTCLMFVWPLPDALFCSLSSYAFVTYTNVSCA